MYYEPGDLKHFGLGWALPVWNNVPRKDNVRMGIPGVAGSVGAFSMGDLPSPPSPATALLVLHCSGGAGGFCGERRANIECSHGEVDTRLDLNGVAPRVLYL